jgi:glycosyltransferase involved in cell wall biosynthesis
VIVIDDGSSRTGAKELERPYAALAPVEVLHLSRNLGHQRAIAIGLTFVHQERPCDAVVVMDGDGEDRPEDVPKLLAELEASGGAKVVFAQRARRSEGLLFRAFYQLFRALHFVLTGVAVRVGNFSAMPFRCLSTFVVVSEAWNHYAAAVVKARIPYTMVPIARGERLAGRSKMSFVSLVTHGLSAISVFGDVVGVRILIAALIGLAAWSFCLFFTLLLPLDDQGSVPSWALVWAVILFVLCAQILLVAFTVTLFILSSRNNMSFLPARDYRFFVSHVERLGPEHG